MEISHAEREHSKFSASGSERWLNCAFSIDHEEASPPSEENPWAREGTKAHEVLEITLNSSPRDAKNKYSNDIEVDDNMFWFTEVVAKKIKAIQKAYNAKLLVEKKVRALHIHEDMFGTCDAIIVKPGEILHIIDFKYGIKRVEAKENTQLIQYALSVADYYDWNFITVKMWIMQPRLDHEHWYNSWTIPIEQLQDYWLPLWKKGVARYERGGNKPFPGSWCHWCRGRQTCPSKTNQKVEKIVNKFKNEPIKGAK